MTPLLLATALLFPPQPAVQAEGRVVLKGVKLGLVAVRRAEIDYVLKTDGTVRATGTAVITGDVTAKIVHLSGDLGTGQYTCVLDLLGGRMELTGKLATILQQLLPE